MTRINRNGAQDHLWQSNHWLKLDTNKSSLAGASAVDAVLRDGA